MAVPTGFDLERFNIGTGIYLKQSYPVYGKMFEPYNIPRPSSWHWDTDFYTEGVTNSYDCTNFQQGNEVYAGTWTISNRSYSTISFRCMVYLDQYIGGQRVESQTCVYDFGTQTIRGQQDITVGEDTETITYANSGWLWGGIDPDEIRPGITQYRLRMQINYEDYDTITFSVSNLSFNTSVCNAGYMWVEGAFLCYVPPCIYSGSSTTGYKHVVQYDTDYSGATGQTPGMIWIPEDSTDHHIYYVTANGVVRRTKETYARPYSPSTTFSTPGSVWMTPSTSYSNEETGYNYICYIDGGGYRRRLGPGDVN